jgi:ABC-type uncharacterized transport system substrate-binding protein
MIARASKAPVYALWSNTIGVGVAGGYVLGVEKIGKQAVDMCLRILKGKNHQTFRLNVMKMPTCLIGAKSSAGPSPRIVYRRAVL